METATNGGVLKGQAAAKARGAYGQAHDALLAARAAEAAGDYALELSKASQATAAAGQLQAVSSAGAGVGVATL